MRNFFWKASEDVQRPHEEKDFSLTTADPNAASEIADAVRLVRRRTESGIEKLTIAEIIS